MTAQPETETGPRPSVPVFRRVLLKLSGEALMGEREYGIDPGVTQALAKEVAGIRSEGVAVAVVVGGGNFYRGLAAAAESGMDRATADYAGMLATLLNALALQDALEREGADTRAMSALEVSEVAEPYIRRRAIRHLEKGRVVIFAAGTGNPFFTTDTAAALRALEMGADAILMAKHGVKGVYDGDPRQVSDAEFLPRITHLEAIERGLKVMDTTALSLCMDNRLTIHVFELAEGNVARVVNGEEVGTIIATAGSADAEAAGARRVNRAASGGAGAGSADAEAAGARRVNRAASGDAGAGSADAEAAGARPEDRAASGDAGPEEG